MAQRREVQQPASGGDAQQITGSGPARAAWLEQQLQARPEQARAGDVDGEPLEAVRNIGGAERQRPAQPRVGLLPLVVSLLGALPMAAVLGLLGVALYSDGAGLGLLWTTGLLVVVASVAGTWLADPVPILSVPECMQGEASS